jgi:hypothetical protein
MASADSKTRSAGTCPAMIRQKMQSSPLPASRDQ